MSTFQEVAVKQQRLFASYISFLFYHITFWRYAIKAQHLYNKVLMIVGCKGEMSVILGDTIQLCTAVMVAAYSF